MLKLVQLVNKMENRLDDVKEAIVQLEDIIKKGRLHDADSLELQKWLKRYKSDAEQYDVHLTEMRQSRG